MTSILLEKKYKEIETNIISVKEKSTENEINQFLDKINLVKRFVNKITISVNEMDDILYAMLNEEKKLIYSDRNDFKKLIKQLKSVYTEIKESNFYLGTKTVLSEMKLAISNFEEIIDDVIFFYEAQNNEDYNDIFSKIISA